MLKSQILLEILTTLAGKDEETRSEIAFLLIMAKLETSESLKKWNYIVKNLIILDRCVEEKYYLNDISSLNLPHIEFYKEIDNGSSIF